MSLYSNYEDLCLPTHEGLRRTICKKFKYWDFDERFKKDKQFYRWLKRFLEKSLGKPFPFIHKKIREKLSETSIYDSPLEVLFSYVDRGSSNTRWREYYFNSKDILCKKKNDKQKSTIGVYEDVLGEFLFVDHDKIKENPKIDNALLAQLGYNKYDLLMSNEYVGKSLGYQAMEVIQKTGHWGPNPYIRAVTRFLVKEYEKGSREYAKYSKERQQARNKQYREEKDKKFKEGEELLRRIEARRKELEERLNTVTRNRLGFNEDSFMGEPYHGQKRKKRKAA